MTGSKSERQKERQQQKIALCTKGLKKKVSIVEQKSRIACLAREHYFNPWKPTLSSRYAEKKNNKGVLRAIFHTNTLRMRLRFS